MNEQTFKQELEKISSVNLFKYLLGIFVIAIVIIAFAFTIYFIKFHGSLSATNGDWGTFGDFIGGTLNPILSFLSLIALLVTIFLQSKELEHTREELTKTADAAQQQIKHFQNESKRSDVYRLIEKLVERIDQNYKVTFLLDDEMHTNPRLIDLVSKRLRDVHFISDLKNIQIEYENKTSSTFNTLWSIERDFELLLHYLKKYEATSDGRYLLDFYRAEYCDLMNFLFEHELLLDEKLYHDFFHS